MDQNGLLLMGGTALLALLLTGGSVTLLVVLYSINVFLTFTLSQLGMCRHWLRQRGRGQPWKYGLAVNGVGLMVIGGILVSLSAIKFFEGGWVTLVATAAVVLFAWRVRRHYDRTAKQLSRLEQSLPATPSTALPPAGRGRTAILLSNGFNGLGKHAFHGLFRMFPGSFDRVVVVQVGAVDAGSFKGVEELERLRDDTQSQARRFRELGEPHGVAIEVKTAIGIEVLDELQRLVDEALVEHPEAVVFAGQLAFLKETTWTRLLHNYVVFTLQRIYCRRGIPFVVVPVGVG